MSSDGAGATGAASMVQDRDVVATIHAWRERGADRFDPVRFRFIEVLAARAAGHGGDARSILEDKVAKLLAAYGEDLERARSADGKSGESTAASPCGESRPHRGALAELVEHVACQASSQGNGPAASDVHGAPAELKTLTLFRSTWSRLRADQRLTQSLTKVSENAGPLNSHRLVHRSLTLMRDLSPEYLNRFMSYVDALLWLDQANGGSAFAGKDVPLAESDRKRGRGRAG